MVQVVRQHRIEPGSDPRLLINIFTRSAVKTGRPAPLGRKKPVGIRLTPDVLEFCKQHPDGFTFLEDTVRKSKAFRDWKKQQR